MSNYLDNNTDINKSNPNSKAVSKIKSESINEYLTEEENYNEYPPIKGTETSGHRDSTDYHNGAPIAETTKNSLLEEYLDNDGGKSVISDNDNNVDVEDEPYNIYLAIWSLIIVSSVGIIQNLSRTVISTFYGYPDT